MDLTEVFLIYRESVRAVWNGFARGVEGTDRHFGTVEAALFDLFVRAKMNRRLRTARVADRSYFPNLRVLLKQTLSSTPILRGELEQGEWQWREDSWNDQRGDLRYVGLFDLDPPPTGERDFAFLEAVVIESYDGLRVGTRVLLSPRAIRMWEIDAAVYAETVVEDRSRALRS